MFNNILIVCVGNICRSPALERLLAEKLPGKQVHSAGLAGVVGWPIDAQMQALMDADGVNSANHAARKLDARLLREADVVIAMEDEHLRAIRAQWPESAAKGMLATRWLDGSDVADPYRKSNEVFAACYQQLKACAESWAERLQ